VSLSFEKEGQCPHVWPLVTQGLERLVTEHNVAGVHGRLVDLIDCAPQLSTAVEVTAGVDMAVWNV
jgi:chromosome segregation ATPase